jgi:hypothetical protein
MHPRIYDRIPKDGNENVRKYAGIPTIICMDYGTT